MLKNFSFNIDNKFNNCQEFVNYITAEIFLTEEPQRIIIYLNSLTVNDNRAKNYFVRHKQYITFMPLDENETSLERILFKANKHVAKVTQEMHELNFTSIQPGSGSLDRQGYKTASSFKELLKFGEDKNTMNGNYDEYTTFTTYEEAQQDINKDISYKTKRPHITIEDSFGDYM